MGKVFAFGLYGCRQRKPFGKAATYSLVRVVARWLLVLLVGVGSICVFPGDDFLADI